MTDKSTATFVSSLDIPIQGAIPIENESGKVSGSNAIALAPVEFKRAPRKSKTDALAALNNQARSSSDGPDDMYTSEDLTEKYRNAPPIPVSARLDLSTVKTYTPRLLEEAPSDPRPFGLTDCPEFYPTVEEFKDPMAYIKSISPKAKDYGICKIVPPQGWKMPFVTDTEVCHLMLLILAMAHDFLEFPLQNTFTASKFHRSFIEGEAELPRTALSIS